MFVKIVNILKFDLNSFGNFVIFWDVYGVKKFKKEILEIWNVFIFEE